ncbi:MAG: ARMT1-like domain-containing protein [Spirochaetota bacterium]
MKLKLDCVPCLIRHSIEAARFISNDESFQKLILDSVLSTLLNTDLSKSPPALAKLIHRKIREISGIADPYKKAKEGFNALASSLMNELAVQINRSHDPLASAVKLAIAGNIIDSGAKTGLSEKEIKDTVNSVFTETVMGDIDEFSKNALKAKDILFLADNAGEIFFDRLLIEKLGHPNITLAVRGNPVINDATMEDAAAAGLDKAVKVIENGSDAPGTIVEECSDEFRRYFAEADMVISKGQGNYETLCDEKKNIYFLLKIKCPVIAEHTGFPVGSGAVIRSAQYSI